MATLPPNEDSDADFLNIHFILHPKHVVVSSLKGTDLAFWIFNEFKLFEAPSHISILSTAIVLKMLCQQEYIYITGFVRCIEIVYEYDYFVKEFLEYVLRSWVLKRFGKLPWILAFKLFFREEHRHSPISLLFEANLGWYTRSDVHFWKLLTWRQVVV